MSATSDRLAPIHPGEVLAADFLQPMSLTQYQVAKAIRVPLPRVNAIVRGKRGITADTALRLARFFGTTAEFWMNLQSHYDLERRRDEIGDQLDGLLPMA